MRILLSLVWLISAFFSGLAQSSPLWSDCALDLAESYSSVKADWAPSAWGPATTLSYRRFVLRLEEYHSFQEIALLVDQISKGRPLIGIGRSPGPYTTYLSLLPQHDIVNLAISDFRNRPFSPNQLNQLPDAYLKKSKFFAPLSAEAQDSLFEYFDHRLYSFLAKQTGTVFLTDVGESGASLFATQKYLTLFAAHRKLNVQFESIIITNSFFQNNVAAMAKFFAVQPHIIVSENLFVTETLTNSKWDRFAEFNRFGFYDLLRTSQTSTYDSFTESSISFGQGEPNLSFQRFRTAVQANMLGDPKLKNFKISPIDLRVPGVEWNPLTRQYLNSAGDVIHLSTHN